MDQNSRLMQLSMKEKVIQYSLLHADMITAAEELFKIYRTTLPDKQNWLGRWGWNGNIGTITFDFVDQTINYHYQYFSHGDNNYFDLELPLSALYDPRFMHDEAINWEKQKAATIAQQKEREAEIILEHEEKEKALYLELRRKYDETSELPQ